MDKNTITGLVLIGLILIGFSWFNKPAEQVETAPRQEQVVDQGASSQPLEPLQAIGEEAQEAEVELPPYMQPRAEQVVELKNALLSVAISSHGGAPIKAVLQNYKNQQGTPVILFDGKKDITVNLPLRTIENNILNTSDAYFRPLAVTDSTVVMRMDIADGSYLDIRYYLPKDDYRLRVELSGKELNRLLPANISFLDMEWRQRIPQQEQSWKFEQQYSSIYYQYPDGDVERETATQETSERITDQIQWLSFSDKYFSTVLIGDNVTLEDNEIKIFPQPEGSGYVQEFRLHSRFPFNLRDQALASFVLFVGPNDYELLASYNDTTIAGKSIKLDHLVYLGVSLFRTINRYLIIPVVTLLSKFISNWGIIILLLTLFIKLLLSPLTFKSYLSQAKMRVLRPEVEEINKKYTGTDRETMVKRQTETMNLYRAAGVSMWGGCLPMLLQMPFFIALYMYFPTNIMLRGESFLWAKDLSTYDPVIHWSGNIPLVTSLLGNHISLFTLLMTVTNIIYNRYMMNQSSSSGQAGMPSMKMMPYIMAIMFFFMFNQNASGLSYYYFISTLITILQYFGSRYLIDEKKVLAKLEENKRKPRKKSKWQQRLEEAQRQQQAMARQRKK